MQPLIPRNSVDYIEFHGTTSYSIVDYSPTVGWDFINPLIIGDDQTALIRRLWQFWRIISE